MKKVLLIGGNGFIGKNVREFFRESDKYEIVAPSSAELNIVDEDKVTSYLQENYYDIILNFALYGSDISKINEENKMLEYNLRMFLNFEKNSHLYGKMYYAGSGAEYDKRYDIIDVTETDEGKSIPIDKYGLMKYTVDKIIRNSSNIYCLKLFGVYGMYEEWERRFISNCCCKAIKGLPLSIKRNCYFDYLYVKDFCKILEKLMDITPKSRSINVVKGEKIDLYTIAKMVLEISDKKIKIYVCQDTMGNEYTASNKTLIEEIGNFEYTDMKESLIELYRWYEKNEKEIDLEKLLY